MSTNNNNLDITTVDTSDLDTLAQRIEEYYKADTSIKSSLAYHWERNHMFLDGKQWIVYDGERGRGGQWRQLTVSAANEYIPRPVTNYIYDAYQTLKAYLIQHRPRISVTPNTQAYQDKQAAKLATLVSEADWERLKEEKNYEYAASCGITYGTVFKKDYWDTSALMIAKVPRMAPQPVTDPATGQVIGMEDKEVRDQDGMIVYDELPLGDVNTTVVEPYRLCLDPLAYDLHNTRWIMEYSIQPLEWISETYGREEEGYTGRIEEVKAEKNLSSSLQRFFNLKTSSGTRSGGSGLGRGGQDEMVENAAVLKEYYEAPTRANPKGRMVAVANGIPLYAGPSPYEGPELGDWHPYSEFRWEIVPGRFWGKAPLDEAVEPQKQINSIDAVIILTRKTQAIPQKVMFKDSGLKPGEASGRPGHEYWVRAGGTPPMTLPAAGVDQQVFAEREQKVNDIKAISGAVDILKGDRPPGVTAASALEMLFEVGTGKLKPALERWKMFIESSQKKRLRLIAKRYREPRPEFTRLLMARNKSLPEETVKNFLGTDLYDNCNVTIEAGSNIPKLQSAEKALLMEMAKAGTLNLDSPQNKIEFNRRMGIVGFDAEVGPDVSRAEWENGLMEDAATGNSTKPVVLADENHDIHLQIHLNRMKEPAFMALDELVHQAYQAHMQEHEQYVQQQKMMEQQEAAMTGQPPEPKAEPGQGLHPAGNGAPAGTAKAIFAGDIPKGPG